jgi:predicted Rossmann fold nucleotide-binding protein DprA/Smf involved in DNA uptake
VDDVENKNRNVYLLPRQAADQKFEYKLDEKGRFCSLSKLDSTIDLVGSPLMDLFRKESSRIFKTAEVRSIAEKFKISSDQTERWLQTMVEAGSLERVCRGHYRALVAN